jgi:hypothetical protein
MIKIMFKLRKRQTITQISIYKLEANQLACNMATQADSLAIFFLGRTHTVANGEKLVDNKANYYLPAISYLTNLLLLSLRYAWVRP